MLLLALLASAAPQDFTVPPGQYKVVVALKLSDKGKVKACSVAQTSGFADADKKTCKQLLKNGQFDPIRNEAGVAIEGVTTESIRWKVADPES